MRKLSLLGLFAAIMCIGCGSSGGNKASISVGVTPSTASVQAGGGTQQFTATVSGDSSNRGVTWSVAGTGCTGSACGTINSSGLYTAPSSVPSPAAVTVTATSVANTAKNASAVATITAAASGVAVSPNAVPVVVGRTQQFTAAVTPSNANQSVTWSLSGTGCSGASCGTIDSTGYYTAPATVPTPAIVTATATSVSNTSETGSSTITVIPVTTTVNTAVNGQYAFLFNGYDSHGAVAIAGDFTADGNGNIAAGTEDISRASGVTTSLAFTGTYTANSDNRGTMTLTSTQGSAVFPFALSAFTTGVAARGRFIEADSSGTVGVGVLAKQNPAGFSTAAVSGGYAFGFSGVDAAGNREAMDGRFTASAGAASAGQVDANDNGTATVDASATGTYTVAASGRGTLALSPSGLGTINMSFYVVSATELFAMEVDARTVSAQAVVSGTILQQSGSPYAASSLNAASVVDLTGTSGTNSDVLIGLITFNGAGSLTGTTDENNAGTVSLNSTVGGTYTVDANGLGRGVITITGTSSTNPIYLVSANSGFIINTGSGVSEGSFTAQTGGPFTNASLTGSYALGTLPTISGAVMISSDVAISTAGNLTGTLDVAGALGQTLTGAYSISSNGSGTLTLTPVSGTPLHEVFFLISPTSGVAIDSDASVANSSVIMIEQ